MELEEERRFCPDRACNSGAWLVQRIEQAGDYWVVMSASEDGSWLVAATDPVCPRCGATLATLLDLDGGLGESDFVEIGPIFDFARSL